MNGIGVCQIHSLNHMQKSLLITIAGLSALPLSAQQELNPLFVTASRQNEEMKDVPYSLDTLSKEFIQESQFRSLPETLQYTPGVLIQKTTVGHGSPVIRGFIGRQNLLMMDGVKMNNSTYRSGPIQYWNTIDPLVVENMELVKNQGSVLYGSDAIGGTLNVFGKNSKFREKPEGQLYAGGSMMGEYRSNGEGSQIGRLEAETGIGGKFGVMLGVSMKDFGDIESHAIGRMKGTGYQEQDYDLRADYAIDRENTLSFASYYVNQDDISRWHRTINNPGWMDGGHVAAPGTWTADTYDQERSLTYLKYSGKNSEAGAPIQRWQATLSYQSTNDSEFQDRRPASNAGSRPIRASDIDVNTYGLDLELESKLGKGELVYGFDFYHDEVGSSGYQTNATNTNRRESLPIADDSSYSTFGLYGQYVWHATDTFDLTAGARYTHVAADMGRYYDAANVQQFGSTETWDAMVGNIRGIQHLNKEWSVYGGISQSFRAPNLDDLTGNMTSRSGADSTGNVNLDPERYVTFEIGTRHQQETLAMGASVFYTMGEDMISGVPLTSGNATTRAINASDGYSMGVELEGAWQFAPQWQLNGFVAWQEGRTETPSYIGGPSVERPNVRQLPMTGSMAIKWTAESAKYWVEARVLATSEEERYWNVDQAADNQRLPTNGTPGYIVASLRAGWQVNSHLDLNAGIENITDEDYRIHGSGQNEPGIGAVLGARVKW